MCVLVNVSFNEFPRSGWFLSCRMPQKLHNLPIFTQPTFIFLKPINFFLSLQMDTRKALQFKKERRS